MTLLDSRELPSNEHHSWAPTAVALANVRTSLTDVQFALLERVWEAGVCWGTGKASLGTSKVVVGAWSYWGLLEKGVDACGCV
jgi:hypothetical protein